MSIWQNFKETDHWAEKRIIGGILAIPLFMGFVYFVSPVLTILFSVLPSIPVEVVAFHQALGAHTEKFLVAAIVVFIISARMYNHSLEGYDEETDATQKAKRISYILWLAFAFTWIFYCIWVTLHLKVLNTATIISALFLIYLSCCLIFLVSKIAHSGSD